MRNSGLFAALATSTSIVAMAAPAHAQQATFNIPAGPLKSALDAYGRQSGRPIVYKADEVRGIRSPGFHGRASPEQALQAILAKTGLSARTGTSGSVAIIREGNGQSVGANPPPVSEDGGDIVVTGSRLRGVAIPSTLIVERREKLLNEGKATLGEAIANIPQNFTGGMNPGIGADVPESKGSAAFGGYALNLRGLGADATLTLVNGRRVVFAGFKQGIDISAIPLIAVERLEIVPDGSSALYGSDAVAGVANVMLRRDYNGFATTARFGASTDGGNERQMYSAMGGQVWESGGFVASYEFSRNTPILASDRDYAATRPRGLTLFPALKSHSIVVSGHQQIGPNVELEMDALYNKRWINSLLPLDINGTLSIESPQSIWSITLSPALHWRPSDLFEAYIAGSYSAGDSNFSSNIINAGNITPQTKGCYCSNAKNIEVGISGPTLDLPAGPLKMAVGAGYRSNFMRNLRTVGSNPHDIAVTQSVYYTFGELNVPLVGPDQETPLIRRINLSVAGRYESYPDEYDVLTPKIGLIYEPVEGLSLKGSWGKSFRAPTLYERFSNNTLTLTTAASRGGSGFPAAATALIVFGGNPDLTPEKSTNWSVGAMLEPSSGLRIEASYFNVKYRNRVVTPLLSTSTALSDPIYADYITRNPTAQQIAAAVARGPLSNASGAPYNASNIVAIINNVSVNAASQFVEGLDVSTSYHIDTGAYGSLDLSIDATYLRSNQKLTLLRPSEQLAGTVYNPPHWRGRAGIGWAIDSLSLNALVSRIGGLDDRRQQPNLQISSMTTLDLNARYRVEKGLAPFRGLDLSIGVQNVLNAKPGFVRTTNIYDTPYDSTNFSPTGRFVTFSVTKKW